MSKEEAVGQSGVVTDALPGGQFKVQLENGHVVLCHISGKIRTNKVRIILGDRVDIEMSPYDLKKGRIVYRHR